MKRKKGLLKKIFLILLLVLLLFGCAAPQIPMHTPVGELSQVDQNHGIVIGSVLIKGPKTILGTRPSFELVAKDVSEIENQYGKKYLLETTWLEEKIFVIKMPAGDYCFTEHRFAGSLSSHATYAYIDQRFTVQPGKTVYIGHLAIEYYGRHLLRGDLMDYSFIVTDRREHTLAAAEKSHGRSVHNAVTDLMGKLIVPKTFTKIRYRPKEKKSLLAWTHTGGLTIGKQAIEYSAKGKELRILYSSVTDVKYGKLGWDTYNEWVIVTFQVEGSEKIAAFLEKTRTREMYRTFLKAYADSAASKRGK
jgi:hypothetical protein